MLGLVVLVCYGFDSDLMYDLLLCGFEVVVLGFDCWDCGLNWFWVYSLALGCFALGVLWLCVLFCWGIVVKHHLTFTCLLILCLFVLVEFLVLLDCGLVRLADYALVGVSLVFCFWLIVFVFELFYL